MACGARVPSHDSSSLRLAHYTTRENRLCRLQRPQKGIALRSRSQRVQRDVLMDSLQGCACYLVGNYSPNKALSGTLIPVPVNERLRFFYGHMRCLEKEVTKYKKGGPDLPRPVHLLFSILFK